MTARSGCCEKSDDCAAKKAKKRAYDQARYAAIRSDPERLEKRKTQVRRAASAYYHRQPELQRQRTKEWRKSNPEKRDALKRRWQIKYRDVIAAKSRARYWKNRDRNVVKSRAWYASNKDRAKKTVLAWRRKNKDRTTQYANKRRALAMESKIAHTLDQWLDRLDQFGWACFYCGRADVALTRDHVIPLSRGGHDGIANIVPACRSCNTRKRHYTLPEYLDWKEKYAA